jgi:hypothetical protein
MRKVILIDHFLQQKFTINAKDDFGVSVAGAATRAMWWSERIVAASAMTCSLAMALWWSVVAQPPPSIDSSLVEEALLSRRLPDDTCNI